MKKNILFLWKQKAQRDRIRTQGCFANVCLDAFNTAKFTDCFLRDSTTSPKLGVFMKSSLATVLKNNHFLAPWKVL